MLSLLQQPAFVFAAITGGCLAIGFALLYWQAGRQALLVRQFRSLLPVFSNSLREGRTCENAFQILADLAPHPLCRQFRELKPEATPEERQVALEAFCQKVPCFESAFLTAALASQHDQPELLHASLVRCRRLAQNRQTQQEDIARLCRPSRLWMRGVLLLGPLLLAAVMILRPARIVTAVQQLSATATGWLLAGCVLLAGLWLVLILQKQDESEIVLD